MLVRLVVAILLAAFVCWLFSALRTRLPKKKAVPNKNGKIVACSYCSLYVPLEESVFRSARPYCSAKHADLGAIK
jgi:hypothetical protein